MISQAWYFRTTDGQRKGPFSAGELKRLAETGVLQPTDEACVEGSCEWRPVGEIPGIFEVSSPADSVPAISVKCQCGRTYRLKAALAGKHVKCPDCGQPILVVPQGLPAPTASGADGLFPPPVTSAPPPIPLPPPVQAIDAHPSATDARRGRHRRASTTKWKLLVGMGLVLLVALAAAWWGGVVGSKTSWMSKAEFRKKAIALNQRKTGLAVPMPLLAKEVDLVKTFGHPARTQTIDDETYWYWDCRDGTIQMVIWLYRNPQLDWQIGEGVLFVQQINDY